MFENSSVLQQLRCGGVTEAIRISCARYLTRRIFDGLLSHFGILAPEVSDGMCSPLLHLRLFSINRWLHCCQDEDFFVFFPSYSLSSYS
ncbi:hypothetical protein Nepgr_027676 [Nepenthes gracilis]|uniref:Myosin motor domain-containing protein n=1 Tax=Nepenthes gracilis TaxID=150966 RepID=A0AAD3T988_NEPGR|nr:hypothetical protein Nepgr_027676 [Nepenthes gracilis]